MDEFGLGRLGGCRPGMLGLLMPAGSSLAAHFGPAGLLSVALTSCMARDLTWGLDMGGRVCDGSNECPYSCKTWRDACLRADGWDVRAQAQSDMVASCGAELLTDAHACCRMRQPMAFARGRC